MQQNPANLRTAEAPVPAEAHPLLPLQTDGSAGESQEDVGAYLLELLIAARRLAAARGHRFLAYLIGMAAEEARLLTMGRSAADRNSRRYEVHGG